MTTPPRASARLFVRVTLAAVLIALLASCRPMNSSETSLFVDTNNLRELNGLPYYDQQEPLIDQARMWAQQMAAKQSLLHSDPTTWNVPWTAVAENVGVAGDIGEIYAKLAASPHHRDNMLSTKYTHMAVGTARGKDGRIYAVQLFWRG